MSRGVAKKSKNKENTVETDISSKRLKVSETNSENENNDTTNLSYEHGKNNQMLQIHSQSYPINRSNINGTYRDTFSKMYRNS